jgi:hypothetical protein
MWQLPPLEPEEILIYLRKSRTDDPRLTVEEVLANHEQMLDEWFERNYPGKDKVPEANRFREVVSGETLDSRPRVLEVLRKVESPRAKAVMCADPQRLSRGDLEDIGRLVKLLRYSNTIVITLGYTYDLRDERDRDSFERELKRGNEFLEYQKRIMNNGRLLSVQNGNFIGQHAPYGYRKVEVREGKKKCFILEPHPDEAPVVKLVFDLYLQGLGAERISDRLAELGVRPPRGKRWAGTTLRTMLGNEHYLGKVRWERKKTVKTVENGVVISRRPVAEEYLVFPGKHPAIIDQETWDAVQAKRGTIPRNKKASNLSNPLSGILFCSCGRAMARHTYVRKGKTAAAPRYQCRDQKYCDNASCVADDLIAEVKRALLEALEDFDVRVETGTDDSIEVHRQLVVRLERRLAELEALEVSQWDKYTQEGMPKHIFDLLNQKALAEKAEVQDALCTARGAIPEPVDFVEKAATFRAVLEMLDDPDAPVKELNALMKACIERITYSRPKKQGKSSRWETGEPFTLDITLKV